MDGFATGAGREPDPDDPMELAGVAFPGDTQQAMAECFVEEYVLQGFDDAQILRLFQDPFFAGTHAVWRERGEAYVRSLIENARSRWGFLRFRTEVPHRGPEEVHRA
ncbi:MAG: hypothetical protein ACK44W_00225 [Planctomycetota bacterium]